MIFLWKKTFLLFWLRIFFAKINAQDLTRPAFPPFFGPQPQPNPTRPTFSGLFGDNNPTQGPVPNFFGITAPTTPVPKVPSGNLSCYSCKLDFRKVYDSSHPCLGRHGSNLSNEYIVNCGVLDIFCRVERTEVNGILTMLSRECIDTCYFGCRPKGFGINSESCAECCTSFACNNNYPKSTASNVDATVTKAVVVVLAFKGWRQL